MSLWKLAVCLLLAGVAGCGNSSRSSGSAAGVSGAVKAPDGSPLPYGVVELQAMNDRTLARQARVLEGKYTLAPEAGLVEGDYAVRVLPLELEVEQLSEFTDEQRRAINQARNLIPTKYQQAGALAVHLAAGPANTFDVDLSQ